MLFIVYKIINNKKITLFETYGNDKEKLRNELKNNNVDFSGIDSIKNIKC